MSWVNALDSDTCSFDVLRRRITHAAETQSMARPAYSLRHQHLIVADALQTARATWAPWAIWAAWVSWALRFAVA